MSNSLTACFGGSTDLTSDPKYINKKIDEQLRIAKKMAKSQIKLLVLGAAESGKSTFIKQMQIIHGKGYTMEERKDFKSNIVQNISTSIRLLSFGMEKLEISYEDEACKIFGNNFSHYHDNMGDNFTKEFVQNVVKFWNDEGVQTCYKRRNEFHLLDSASYFLNEIDRISAPDYLPNLQDILRSRNPTAGICEYVFDIDKFIFGMVDVGGQKSERRKWIHCFDNVNSIIFLASLSEYDQTIPQEEIDQETAYSQNGTIARKNSSSHSSHSDSYDDNQSHHNNHHTTGRLNRNHNKTVARAFSQQTLRYSGSNASSIERRDSKLKTSKSARESKERRHHKPPTTLPPFPNASEPVPIDADCYLNINRMRESCALFQTIVHSCWFRSTSVILFLNKTDILEEKVQYSHLRLYDPTYEGPEKDAEAAKNHILDRYVKCFNNRQQHRNSKRTLYSHFTCATDTNNIRFVFAAIKDIILQNYLENYNLI